MDWNAVSAVSTCVAVALAFYAIIRGERLQAFREHKRLIEQRLMDILNLAQIEPDLSLRFQVDLQRSLVAAQQVDRNTITEITLAMQDRWSEENRAVDVKLTATVAFLRGAVVARGPYEPYREQFVELSQLIETFHLDLRRLRVVILSGQPLQHPEVNLSSDPVAERVRLSSNAVSTACVAILCDLYKPTFRLRA